MHGNWKASLTAIRCGNSLPGLHVSIKVHFPVGSKHQQVATGKPNQHAVAVAIAEML